MRVLIVKMSSLGDVIHTFPAVTELCDWKMDAEVHWMVEEAFANVPGLHPGVHRVWPCAIRRWRKNWWAARKEVRAFAGELRKQNFDVVVDAQGLVKSSIVSSLVRAPVHGYGYGSAREGVARPRY